MSIPFDLNNAIGLSRACPLMRGKGGAAPSVETVRRWANPKRGCYPAGRGGTQLVLRSVRVNGEVLTMREWVEEFERERVRLGSRAPTPELSRPAGKRERQVAAADRRLDQAGIGEARA